MKQHLDKWSLVLILATFPLVSGCYSETANPPATSATPAPAVVTAPPVVSTAPDPVVTMAPPPVDVSMAVAATIDQPLPPNINPAGPAASVIKLAQAGVGENVIQSYIANSTAPFNLGSDDIIYLRDLGVSDAVITAMIQRDQALGNVASAQPAYAAPSPTVIEQAPPATVVETAPADVNYTYFYDSLAPYGSWVEVEGYGRCFQPTVVIVNRSWQPYCDNGHWVYTDSGWYWVSDYSWGWATFHYGRWFRHASRGWCWAPDSEWGPAWVSWRYNSDYCGWAPLPPTARYRSGVGFTFRGRNVDVSFGFGLTPDCYTFVPTGRFSDRHPDRFRAPRNQETHIYSSTTVINNIVVGNNNTIINRGLGTERIERATHETIRPIHIRANADRNPRGGRHEQFDAGGGTLIVNRPPLREHGPDAGRNAPQVGGSPRNTFGGDRDRNANDNNARSPIVRPPGDRGNNPQGNNPPAGNQRGRGNENTPSTINPRPADRNNSQVINTPPGNQPNGGNAGDNNPRSGNAGSQPNRGNNPSSGNVVTRPRSDRPLPLTPAGQNPFTENPAANQNNPPRNAVVSPTPTAPAGSRIVGRQNDNSRPIVTQPTPSPRVQTPTVSAPTSPTRPTVPKSPTAPVSPVMGRQNSDVERNNQRPGLTQPTTSPRVQSPVVNAPANNPRIIRTPDNQNSRASENPRYNSPRIESQVTPPRPVQVQPTFPRDNNNSPKVNSPSTPSGGRSSSEAQPARSQGQDSGSRSGGDRSGKGDSNSDKNPRNR